MQKPPLDPDEKDDTAFGGLAPRSGPVADPEAARRGRRRKWLLWGSLVVVLLLVVLYASGLG